MVPRFLFRHLSELERESIRTNWYRHQDVSMQFEMESSNVVKTVSSEVRTRAVEIRRDVRNPRAVGPEIRWHFFIFWNWTPRNGLYLPIAIKKKNFLLWFTALLTFGYSSSLHLRCAAWPREREERPFPGMERAWERKSHNGWWTGLPRAIEKRAEGPLVIFTATIFI